MPTNFTPISSLAGGILIGAAALLLYLQLGRIAGISGIFNAALEQREGRGWRLAFLLGLAGSGGLWFALSGHNARSGFGLPWLLLAGTLVGFGTRLSNGCTSGHGICGLARLSPRSFAAVLCFMTSAMATVYLLRHGVRVTT